MIRDILRAAITDAENAAAHARHVVRKLFDDITIYPVKDDNTYLRLKCSRIEAEAVAARAAKLLGDLQKLYTTLDPIYTVPPETQEQQE